MHLCYALCNYTESGSPLQIRHILLIYFHRHLFRNIVFFLGCMAFFQSDPPPWYEAWLPKNWFSSREQTPVSWTNQFWIYTQSFGTCVFDATTQLYSTCTQFLFTDMPQSHFICAVKDSVWSGASYISYATYGCVTGVFDIFQNSSSNESIDSSLSDYFMPIRILGCIFIGIIVYYLFNYCIRFYHAVLKTSKRNSNLNTSNGDIRIKRSEAKMDYTADSASFIGDHLRHSYQETTSYVCLHPIRCVCYMLVIAFVLSVPWEFIRQYQRQYAKQAAITLKVSF